jgi:hypothetical protein
VIIRANLSSRFDVIPSARRIAQLIQAKDEPRINLDRTLSFLLSVRCKALIAKETKTRAAPPQNKYDRSIMKGTAIDETMSKPNAMKKESELKKQPMHHFLPLSVKR